jgi:hypothetical protein
VPRAGRSPAQACPPLFPRNTASQARGGKRTKCAKRSPIVICWITKRDQASRTLPPGPATPSLPWAHRMAPAGSLSGPPISWIPPARDGRSAADPSGHPRAFVPSNWGAPRAHRSERIDASSAARGRPLNGRLLTKARPPAHMLRESEWDARVA